MTAPLLCTITDVEAVSQPVPATDQARVTRLIELVSARVVRYTSQRFVEETETITVWPHDGVLRLPQLPVTDVASVVLGGTTLAASAYTFAVNGYLQWTPAWSVNGWDWGPATWDWPSLNYARWPVENIWPYVPTDVTYTHGYPPDQY